MLRLWCLLAFTFFDFGQLPFALLSLSELLFKILAFSTLSFDFRGQAVTLLCLLSEALILSGLCG
ncbi:MAG: hypothetical protein EB006_07185 [Betaproteobacteria bacterium]|nr:hypothetical protein [Betaproteobacteria bacterium]